MIVLSGADLVLPDRVVSGGTLTIDNGHIVRIESEPQAVSSPFAFHGYTIVPGFVDVHVHGVCGVDTMDAGHAIAALSELLPRFGVTAFCPTTMACPPADLHRVLDQVRECRERPLPLGARVLPAHVESNFLNPEYCGAQPGAALRTYSPDRGGWARSLEDEAFTGADVLRVLEERAPDVAIVTLAPEIEGGLELVARLVTLGIRVSLGHTDATCEEALAAIAAGATQATHLFNRMSPLHHRNPGVIGAALQSDEMAVELICDGVHVHPAVVRTVVAAKTPARVMAISDATAAAGLETGSVAALGGQWIRVGESCALLDDGTMAGSLLTLDAAFRNLTGVCGCSLVDAAAMCATTPARQLGLVGLGVLAEGAVADIVVLDQAGFVVQTYVGGRLVFARGVAEGNSLGTPAV